MNTLSIFQVTNTQSIRNAFKKMDDNQKKIIIVVDGNKNVTGIVTDGDLRRSIWDGVDLSQPIETISNNNYKYLKDDYEYSQLESIFLNTSIRAIPILKNNKLFKLVFREDLKHDDTLKSKVDIPLVIMAGGKGTRLDPFTRILPKPLIPVGNDPIIKVIMDKFAEYGISDFYISLNDKANMVKAYFNDHNLSYNIQFVEEKFPLGTAGGLKYLADVINGPFFVSNCDIIINEDYRDILKHHLQNNYAMTIVGSMRHYVIPYGICKTNKAGDLEEISEKPEYDLLVNTGLYLINSEMLSFLPDNAYCDMTDLIKTIQENDLNIGVFPISEKSWLDIGQWEEYNKTIKQLFPNRIHQDEFGSFNSIKTFFTLKDISLRKTL